MKKILLLAIILLNFLVLPTSVAVQKNVVIDRMTQSEAESLELVAPVIVQWEDVDNPVNPAAMFKSSVARKRNGVWRHHWRGRTGGRSGTLTLPLVPGAFRLGSLPAPSPSLHAPQRRTEAL
jgi:hypothetical protein